MHSLEDDLGEVSITKEDEPIVQNEEIRKVSEAAKKLEGKTAHHHGYRWFSLDVIAAMLVDENKRFLINCFCSSTSNCTLQNCYLCP